MKPLHPSFRTTVPERSDGTVDPESGNTRRACCWIPGSRAEPVIGPAKGRTRWLAPRNDKSRRGFMALLGAAAAPTVLWPLAARAQQAMPVIGFLRSAGEAGSDHLAVAFRQDLSEVGVIDGQNAAIVYHYTDDQARLAGLAADLVRRQAAVIVGNTVAARAVMAATRTIPIVFLTGADPVRIGLVDSLSRPSGNVTGVTFTVATITAKRLALLHELVPRAGVIAVLLDQSAPGTEGALEDVEQARRVMSLEVVVVTIRSQEDIAAAFATIVKAGAGALLVGGGPLLLSQRAEVVALAARHGLPASYATRQYLEAGGLMSYGPSQTEAYRQAGVYAGRILKGARPSDLPIMQPTKFEMIINLKTAKTLGLAVPNSMQLLADEVIE